MSQFVTFRHAPPKFRSVHFVFSALIKALARLFLSLVSLVLAMANLPGVTLSNFHQTAKAKPTGRIQRRLLTDDISLRYQGQPQRPSKTPLKPQPRQAYCRGTHRS